MTTKKRRKTGQLHPGILADVVKRVVAAAKPDKIILFGSAARGTMGPDSDLDLLVIKDGKYNRDRITMQIYRQLGGIDIAVDVVVATPEEIERYRETHCLIICPALREGKEIYGAQTIAST
jgi:predicted nucleotidyltransferase